MATWDVQADYGYGDGWETVTAEPTKQLALQTRDLYRENEPGIQFRVKRDPND